MNPGLTLYTPDRRCRMSVLPVRPGPSAEPRSPPFGCSCDLICDRQMLGPSDGPRGEGGREREGEREEE